MQPCCFDVYTFAVQRNPVDETSLLAIFPLTEPPWACIAFAISRDGIRFSRPVTLRSAYFGVRANEFGELEWRSEDHPVAGATRQLDAPDRILFYIHHAVKGTTVRRNAVPHVRAYSLNASELALYTADGLRQLKMTAAL